MAAIRKSDEKKQKALVAKLKKEQLVADKAKCDDYGIQRWTKEFSACLIQLDQARKQELQQQLEAIRVAQAEAQAQAQEQEREDNAQFWQGVSNVTGQLSQQQQQAQPTMTYCNQFGNTVSCISPNNRWIVVPICIISTRRRYAGKRVR